MTRSKYLEYGRGAGASALNPSATLAFLVDQGFGSGGIAQSRQSLDEERHDGFRFEAFGTGYCDFCFIELMGGAYDVLQDNRSRCVRCSRSVISTEEAFRDEFDAVRRNMEVAFGISLTTPSAVRMVNAKEISKKTGETFTATPAVDPRVLGFVELKDGVQSLYIENGAPRMAAVTTMAHELTHVWQNSNWDMDQISARYGAQNVPPVVEGMAVWVQIQYLLATREYSYAERQLAYAVTREDEYGLGFREFLKRYPLSEEGQPDAASPFQQKWPL